MSHLLRTVLLVLGFASVSTAADRDWMAGVVSSKRISQITIPGTHDSGALRETFAGTAKCQNSTVAEQLNFGIRLLDIRCRHVNNAFDIYHGSENQNLAYAKVLEQVIGFLTANPSECVVMSVMETHTPSGNTRSFEATFDSYVAKNPGKWALGSRVPALKSVRGKIVLLRRFGASTARGIDATNWPNNRTFKLKHLSVQDIYRVSDNTVKWKAVTTALSAAFSSDDSAVLYLNFTSGYKPGFLGIPDIPAVSKAINPQLSAWFTAAPAGHYGWLLMDFADAARTELIYQTNFPPSGRAQPGGDRSRLPGARGR